MSVLQQRRIDAQQHPDPRRVPARAVIRALLSALGLAGIVLGVPVLLIGLGSVLPIDLVGLGPATLLRPDDGGLLLAILLGVAWTAWAVMAVTVAVEVVAALRRAPTPRLPGLAGPQRLAGALVGALVLAVSASPAGAPVAAAPLAEVVARMVEDRPPAHSGAASADPDGAPSDSGAPRGDRPDGAADRAGDGEAAGAAALPSITTQRHDTLWLLAEQHLGSGERFDEIVALNEGVPQPDGRALRPDGRVYPGWLLRLPADAVVTAERPARHVVERGDTLWDIAAEELGDPHRYPEIHAANRGDRQPDGGRLEDPDLIRTGWILEIPGEEESVAAEVADSVPKGSGVAVLEEQGQGDQGPDNSGEGAGREGAGQEGAGREGAGQENGEGENGGGAAVPPLDRGAAPLDTRTGTAPASEPSSAARDEEQAPLPPLDRAVALPGAADDAPLSALSATPTPAPATPPGPASPAMADAGLPLPDGGTLTVLLLAGIGAELARRRRQFQRHRRPGERMPSPSSGARKLEAAARDAVAELPAMTWEDALRALAQQCRGAGLPLPRVRLVEVAPDGSSGTVRLHLAEHADVVQPFRALAERVWEVEPAWAAPQPGASPALGSATEVTEFDDPFPDLVAVGVAAGWTVHVNLAEVGTLRVAGPSARHADVLRALVAETCFGRIRARSTRTLCVADASIAQAVEAGDLHVEPDPARVGTALNAVLAARRAGGPAGADDDPIEVVLADRRLPVAVPPQSGAALITSAPVEGAGAVLALDGAGGAVLLPEGIPIVPQSLPAPSAMALVDLLAATDLPEDPVEECRDAPVAGPILEPMRAAAEEPPRERATAADEPPPERATAAEVPVARVAGEGSAAARLRAIAAQPAPRILLLGEVRVEGATGRAESARVGRLAETAAFVLLNPDARPSALQSALWPGLRSNPQTCRQMISRARTWLGRTDAGEPYLMPFSETGGRLRLRPEVDSDWAQFQALAGVGLADPEDTEHLGAALRLVRGRPFGPVAGRELPWADLSINDMITLITDVAHSLACRHEAAGRWGDARDAALRGLQTESESEVLRAVLARIPVSG